MAEYLGYFVTRERRTDHASAANMFWSVIFLSKPYTSFWLIDCLLQKAKLSYDDLLKDHNILKKTFRKGDIVADPRETSIISPLPGKCTSFAIQVVEKLEKTYKNIYDFQFYRLGPHTVARCQKTGVLIDSSSSGGAITLNDGPWETFNNRDNWAWNPQENRFEKSRPESPEYVRSARDSLGFLVALKLIANLSHRKSIPHLYLEINVWPSFYLGLPPIHNRFVIFGMSRSNHRAQSTGYINFDIFQRTRCLFDNRRFSVMLEL